MRKFMLKAIVLSFTAICIIAVIQMCTYYKLIINALSTDDGNLEKNVIKEIRNESLVPENVHLPNDVSVGDTVIYGKYYDIKDDNGEKQILPLRWDVIDKKDDSVLLITDDIIDNIKYNHTWNPISWADSSVRKWLNEEFYNTAFTSHEQAYITDTQLSNDDNERFDTKAGEDTIDKVFLLSLDDIEKYYTTNESRQAKGTKFAISEGLWVSPLGSSRGYSVWWLRSPGKNTSLASLVHAGGAPGDVGDSISTEGNGVRPCVWVKIK